MGSYTCGAAIRCLINPVSWYCGEPRNTSQRKALSAASPHKTIQFPDPPRFTVELPVNSDGARKADLIPKLDRGGQH
jgi:hypothetical protein